MYKIKIFDSNRGKSGEYMEKYACSTCDRIYDKGEDIWGCSTCNRSVCDSCKIDEHTNHNIVKNDATIAKDHPLDCDCQTCAPAYGYYGSPMFDKSYYFNVYGKIQIGTEDSLYYQECDFNPELLEVIIPDYLK